MAMRLSVLPTLLNRTHTEHSICEIVNADELAARLAQTVWTDYPASQLVLRMTDVATTNPPRICLT